MSKDGMSKDAVSKRGMKTQAGRLRGPAASASRSRKVLTALALGVALAGAGLGTGAGAQEIGMVYSEADGTLFYGGNAHHFREPSAEPTRIYRSSGLQAAELPQPGAAAEVVIWSGTERVSDLGVSANGQYVAFREHLFQENVPQKQANYVVHRGGPRSEPGYFFEDSVLRIITRDGALLHSVPRVRAYAWARSGRRLAYITGDYYEGGLGFVSTGTWVMDVNGRSEPRQIHPGGYDVAWAAKGNDVLVWDMGAGGGVISRYAAKTNSLVTTTYEGIHFSPDAVRYYRPSYEGTDLRIYLGGNDQDVTDDAGFFASRNLRYAVPRGWLNDDLLVVPSGDGSEDFLLDLENGVGYHTDGRVLALGPAEGHVILATGSGVQSVSMKTLDPFYPAQPEG